ncbi:MAG: MFS transporter [Actinobacteria bacterium]|nr:MFS transporter [Actinomycetota bacterium]
MNPAVPAMRMWTIWIVGVLAYVLSVTNRTSLSAVGVDAAHLFQADASTLSLFAVLQLAVYGFMQVPVGVLLDRFGSRPIMVAGMALMAVGQLVMAFAPNVGVAIVARMILGAGDAAIFPGLLRLVAVWFPAQRGPLMAQLTGIVGQMGQLVALLPFPLLMHQTTWSVAFGSLAGLGVLFTVLVLVLVRNRPAERTEDVSVNTDTGAIRVVSSRVDLRVSLLEALAHPGTRLGFWTHFTTPFAGTAFMMLWGIPFLTVGEGLTTGTAALVTTVYVIFGVVFGPLVGALSARRPTSRSLMLVLPAIASQLIVWLIVIAWPGPAPLWLFLLLAVALATGGPASMVAFDHARTHNPQHRLSTATGVVNGGGFLAGLVAIFLIGLALDLQGAGTPESYTLDAFRLAFLTQVPLWILGTAFIIRERRLTRRVVGLDRPRKR